MIQMNNGSKLGIIFGGLGGCLAVGGLPYYYDSSMESMAPVGALLVVAVMFFALAGAFTKDSQWTPKALTFFGYLTAAIVVGITVIGCVDVIFGAAEVIFAALIILVSSCPTTKRFISGE